MQIQPIRLQDIDHVIIIDQSQCENFQNKKSAPKSPGQGIILIIEQSDWSNLLSSLKKKKFKNENFETNFSTLSPLTCYYVFFSWEHLIISFLLVSFPSTLFPSLAPLLSGYSQLYASFIYPPPYTLPLLQTHCRVPVSP